MADLVVSGLGAAVAAGADTLDVITLAEAKLAAKIGASVTTYDGNLAMLITAVSRRFDTLVGPVVIRTVTAETHNGGKTKIQLHYRPVSSVTTVTEYNNLASATLTAESNTAKTANNYSVDLDSGIIYRRASNYDKAFASGRRNVAVTYVAGRAADTASVDARFKEAAKITVAHIWRPEQGFSAVGDGEFVVPAGFAVPNQALELIADDLVGPMVA